MMALKSEMQSIWDSSINDVMFYYVGNVFRSLI